MYRNNVSIRPTFTTDDPFTRNMLWLLFPLTLLSLGLAIASFAQTTSNNNNHPPPFPPPLQCPNSSCFQDNRLSMYDDVQQPVNGVNIWTSIDYHQHLHVPVSSWLHTIGTNSIICLKSGLYFIYLSVQVEVNVPPIQEIESTAIVASSPPSFFNTSDKCHPCNLKFSIRGTQQYGGVGLLTEIVSSLTYSGKEDRFLSKLFYVNATVGDVFRMQFKSHCQYLTISPFFNNSNVFNSYPSSSTISIF